MLTVPTVGEAVDVPPQAKAVMGLVAAGVANLMTDKAQASSVVSHFANKLGVHAKDIGNVIGMSAASTAISYLVEEKTLRPEFQKFACRAPLAAGVSYLSSRRIVRLIFKHIPLLGQYLVCPNFDSSNPDKGCQGKCKDCSLTSGIIVAGLYTVIGKSIDKYRGV